VRRTVNQREPHQSIVVGDFPPPVLPSERRPQSAEDEF
jgi:hypothetical protein